MADARDNACMIRDYELEAAIAALLPASVVVRAGPIVDDGPPLPVIEAALITRALAARRAEFASGRRLARAALAALGRPLVALGTTRDTGPAWPDGVVGSITHADGVAAAVVAGRGALLGLGIDIEGPRELAPSAWESVFTPGEQSMLSDAQAGARLFSAKEAAFKCLVTLGPAPTDFRDFELQAMADGYRLCMPPARAPRADVIVRRRVHGQRVICAAFSHGSGPKPA